MKRNLILIIVAITIVSCNKGSIATSYFTPTGTLTAVVNDSLFVFSLKDSAIISVSSGSSGNVYGLYIMGYANNGNNAIAYALSSNHAITVGLYGDTLNTTTDTSRLFFSPTTYYNYWVRWDTAGGLPPPSPLAVYSGGTGGYTCSMNITHIDSTGIEGTFNGLLGSISNSYRITNGQFSLPVKHTTGLIRNYILYGVGQ